MQKHTVTFDELVAFNPSKVLASSSKERKRLEVAVDLLNNGIWFNVEYPNGNCVYHDLQSAVDAYNKI